MPVSVVLGAALAVSAPAMAPASQPMAMAPTADFAPCADAGTFAELSGSLCLVHRAPLRAPGPAVGKAADSVDLFIRKFPAAGRSRGSVWLVAGGPGESGASFYPFLATLRASFPGFDLIVPDHRGTGYSTRLCPAEEAVGSAGGAGLEGAEWGSCWGGLNAAPDYARAFSITNAAHDLAEMIAAHRRPGPTYVYGVSYGTQLVLRTLEVGRPSVEGVILDSLVPPEATERWDLSRRSEVANAVGLELLRRCDAEPACRQRPGGSAQDGLRRLEASADERLLSQIPGKNLRQFFGGLLDDPAARARIPDLIGQFSRGDTSGLVALNAEAERQAVRFGRYPQAPASVPLVSIISVSENDARPDLTKQQVASEQGALLFASPLPGYLVDPGLPLYARDEHFGRLPTRLPKTLVLQGTLDPKTPFDGASAQVEQLKLAGKVSLTPVADAPHFILMTAPGCFEETVRRFVAGGRKNAACLAKVTAATP